MTLFERLQAHKGGLVHLKSQLYWYYDRGWDGVPGRLCLLLDAGAEPRALRHLEAVVEAATTRARPATLLYGDRTAALLLIDGQPHWVWMVAEDIELLDGAPQ